MKKRAAYIHEIWRYRIEEKRVRGRVKYIHHLEEKISVIKYKKAFKQWVINHFTEGPGFPIAFRLVESTNQAIYEVRLWSFHKNKCRPVYLEIDHCVFHGEPIGFDNTECEIDTEDFHGRPSDFIDQEDENEEEF